MEADFLIVLMSEELNAAQRAAIHYLDGPLLVLAGAGSGKTRVITHKIAYLIAHCDLDPKHIAAMTFTNKAAQEMQTRVAQLLPGASARGLTISTFHALGVRMLREEAAALGYKPQFSIFDGTDCYPILAELSGSVDKARIRGLQHAISQWKSQLLSPEIALATADDDETMLAARVYRDYAATLKAYQAVDFDDLVLLPVQLLQARVDLREKWQNRLRYLLVDEYQDTNACQYALLKLLTGVRAQFTAVGDDDQAIYAWRGADIENLRRLSSDYPQLQVIKLEQNYRSSLRILKAANTLIAHNEKWVEKRLWSDLGPGEAITVTTHPDPDQEAEHVVMKLLAHQFERRSRFADYAILYRSNHQARRFEQHLRQQRIPYRLSGGQSFFEKAEIKDITAYLRLISNSDDDPAFIRALTTPKRGVGGNTLSALGRYAGERQISLFAAALESGCAQHIQARQLEPLLNFCAFINRMEWRAAREPAAQILPDLLAAIDYETWLFDQEEPRAAQTRWNNVQEFVDWLGKKSEAENKTLTAITQSIALINLLDKNEGENPDAVQLSTLHAAKGLEFKHVFLVGLEEGVLPHRESQEAPKLAEERRLMYVGITRAQRSLHLNYSEKRPQGKEWIPCEPSRFITEMHQEDFKYAGGKAVTAPPDKSTTHQRLAAMRALLQDNLHTKP